MTREPLHVVLLDTVTAVEPRHAGAVVVTGSHGGASVVHYARAVPARLYVFNDAGVGKDEAGVAALAELERHGIAAATVAHDSARIGEARDAYDHGVVSRVNRQAAALLVAGRALRPQIEALSSELSFALGSVSSVLSSGLGSEPGSKPGSKPGSTHDSAAPGSPGIAVTDN